MKLWEVLLYSSLTGIAVSAILVAVTELAGRYREARYRRQLRRRLREIQSESLLNHDHGVAVVVEQLPAVVVGQVASALNAEVVQPPRVDEIRPSGLAVKAVEQGFVPRVHIPCDFDPTVW